VLLAVYVFSALRAKPVSNFGLIEDDSLYFSSAKALASGQGYILPSFPGEVRSTKYPILYPLVLAGVWKVDPHFPGNLRLAVALTLVLGCLTLVMAFLLLRRWRGLGDWPALGAVALLGFSGHFVNVSASVMTDVPFIALLLAAIYLVERSLDREHGSGARSAGAGSLTGLLVGLRSLGIPVAAGIGLVLLLKKKYRRLAWFCLPALPLTLLWLWPTVGRLAGHSGTTAIIDPTQSGWTQTLCTYSSYTCNWRMGVPDLHTLAAVVKSNFLMASIQPGVFILHPMFESGSLGSLVLLVLLSVACYAGVVRHYREVGWGAYPVVFLFYIAILLTYPYPPDRYLLPFLPMFYGGLCLEGRHFVSLLADRVRPGHDAGERLVALALALGTLALAAIVAVNYVHGIPAETAHFAERNSKLLAARRGAYDWIQRHTPPDARFIAYDDGLLYLYAGRQAIRPIDCMPQVYYLHDDRYAERDAARLADVALHVRASYWLASADDYVMESPVDFRLLHAREKVLLADSQVVYRSPDGSVVLYDIRCLVDGGQPGCAATVKGAAGAKIASP
jgi:hypothetical protein